MNFISVDPEKAVSFVISQEEGVKISEAVLSKWQLAGAFKNINVSERSPAGLDKRYLPFWIAYYEDGDTVSFDAINALNGEYARARVRSAVAKALLLGAQGNQVGAIE